MTFATNIPFGYDEFDLLILRDSNRDRCLMRLRSLGIIFVFMVWFEHTHVERWMELKLCWKLKFIGNLSDSLENTGTFISPKETLAKLALCPL